MDGYCFSILEDDTTENPERNFPILLPLFFAPPDVKDEVENSRSIGHSVLKQPLISFCYMYFNAMQEKSHAKLMLLGFDFADSLTTVVEYWHTKNGPSLTQGPKLKFFH